MGWGREMENMDKEGNLKGGKRTWEEMGTKQRRGGCCKGERVEGRNESKGKMSAERGGRALIV